MKKSGENIRKALPNPTVVIIGAGFAGLEAAKKLAGKNLEVILLDRNNYHLFAPLLYQVASSGLEPNAIAYPVRGILRGSKNIHFRVCEVLKIDRAGKIVVTDTGSIGYDYLIAACGVETNFFSKDSLKKNSFELKSLRDAIDLRNHVLACFEMAQTVKDEKERQAYKTFLIVGGGPTGIELAGAFSELVRHVLVKDFPLLDPSLVKIIIAESGLTLLGTFPQSLRREAYAKLKELGVTIWLESPVAEIDGDKISLQSGKTLNAKTVVWTAGVKGTALVGDLTLSPSKGYRVPVTKELHLADDENVFVIGDAAFVDEALPMMAPVAIQQARCAAQNILDSLSGNAMKPFTYINRGIMATIGRKAAVASIYGYNFKGFLAWLLWLFVHLFWLIGFRNKLSVMIDWAYNYFTYERGVRLITYRPKIFLDSGKSGRNKTKDL